MQDCNFFFHCLVLSLANANCFEISQTVKGIIAILAKIFHKVSKPITIHLPLRFNYPNLRYSNVLRLLIRSRLYFGILLRMRRKKISPFFSEITLTFHSVPVQRPQEEHSVARVDRDWIRRFIDAVFDLAVWALIRIASLHNWIRNDGRIWWAYTVTLNFILFPSSISITYSFCSNTGELSLISFTKIDPWHSAIWPKSPMKW